MGVANNGLVAPAILYNNPGITREKFEDLLNKTRVWEGGNSLRYFEVWKQVPWRLIGSEKYQYNYHRGLHGLASLLGISFSEKFKAIKWKEKDFNGFPFGARFLSPLFMKAFFDGEKHHPIYTVLSFLENEETRPEEVEVEEFSVNDASPVVEGETYISSAISTHLVDKIIGRRPISDEELTSLMEAEIYPLPENIVRFIGRRHIQRIDWDDFYSLELLLEKHPYFDPDFMYDWGQEGGVFNDASLPQMKNGRKAWKWVQKNGLYSLDISEVPAKGMRSGEGGDMPQSGYTDLVISSEALKLKTWKMFAFHAYERDRTELFLKTFPRAKRAHEKAVWDGYFSNYAKAHEMTISEFLRYRLDARVR